VLTPGDRRLLDHLVRLRRAGQPMPTVRELSAALGFQSKGPVARHLAALRRLRLLVGPSGQERVATMDFPTTPPELIPLLIGLPPQGSLVDPDAYAAFIPTLAPATVSPVPTLAVRVDDDSLSAAGVGAGAVVFLAEALRARDGQLAVVRLDEGSGPERLLRVVERAGQQLRLGTGRGRRRVVDAARASVEAVAVAVLQPL